MGIKERRTKILLGIFLMSDVNFKPVTFNTTIEVAFDLSLNQKTKGTLSALIKEELIEKVKNDSTSPSAEPSSTTTEANSYKLTEKGFIDLSLEFPFFRYLKDKWDGKWRVLSYEIPEKKRDLRDKLRREVAGWGLGPWHRSFWLTPHPIIENLKELVSKKEEEQYIQAFEAEHVFGDKEILIEKVWQKAALDKKYRELFKKWHEILSANVATENQNEAKTKKFKAVITEYVNILKDDPGLPEELVGPKWIGYEAFTIYKEIRSILLTQ